MGGLFPLRAPAYEPRVSNDLVSALISRSSPLQGEEPEQRKIIASQVFQVHDAAKLANCPPYAGPHVDGISGVSKCMFLNS